MLKTIAIAIVVAIAAVLVLAATRPDTFRVERSTGIKAPYSGPSSGKGAVYAWEGNQEVGIGRMKIAEASAPSKVTIELDFVKPFEAHNIVDFTLQPQDGATRVTWAMHGPQPNVAKLMHLFFNMGALVGKDFEAGLANLKAAAEK